MRDRPVQGLCVIRDTGVSAADILAAAAAGLTRGEILDRFPAVSDSDIVAVFGAAASAFQADPHLLLPPLPLSVHVTTGSDGNGLLVKASAQVNGTDHALVPRHVVDSDDGIDVAGVRWRLTRQAAQTLRLLLDRGRQDKHGQIVVRPEGTPEVLSALRSRDLTKQDETAAAIVVDSAPPVCVVAAEGPDEGGIRVSWWFEYEDGLQVPPRALSSAMASGWFKDGNRYIPSPELSEDRPRWLEPRNGQTTLRRGAALKFLRDDLPKLRSLPEDQVRLSGELARWRLIDEPWRSRLKVTLESETLRATPGFVVGDRPMPIQQVHPAQRVAHVGSDWFVQPPDVDERLAAWDDAGLRLDGDTVLDDPDDVATLLSDEGIPLRALADDVEVSDDVRQVAVVSQPTRVVLQADVDDKDQLSVVVGFAAGKHVASWQELAAGPLDSHRWRNGDLVRFDARAAENTARRLHELGATVLEDKVIIARETAPIDPVRNDFQALREIGDVVVSRRLARLADLQSVPAVPTVRISLGGDGLLWLSPRYDVGGKDFALDHVRDGPDGLELYVDGTRVEVDEAALQRFRKAVQEVGAQEDHGRFVVRVGKYGELLGLLENVGTVEYADDFKRVLDGLREFTGIDELPKPSALTAELYPYQQRGFEWLCFLRRYGLHGILADDMGLGKTVQTIALIAKLIEQTPQARVLVVAPRSVMQNWRKDIQRFAPPVEVETYHAAGRKQAARWWEHIPKPLVIVTTYGCLVRDIDILARVSWNLLVLDEAQTIKNFSTKSARSAKSLNAETRLALSGTPIENRLSELWALFDFALPGYLGSHRAFFRRYESPITRGVSAEEQRQSLIRRIRPFVLRRKKDQVGLELPPKLDIPRYCELTNEQVALYRKILDTQGRAAIEEIRQRGSATMHALTAIMRLKQICCHPALVAGDTSRLRRRSGKLETFLQLMDEIHETGEKTLVFSQFTKMLDLLEQLLEERGRRVYMLTGDTQRREAVMEKFTADPEPAIFLISLRAGGVGLNLQAAANVVHYDRWWNPQVEAQATDRAHRIGQTEPVEVFRLDTIGTIEEKIDLLQRKKQELFSQVIDETTELTKAMTADELLSLFEFDQSTGADVNDD